MDNKKKTFNPNDFNKQADPATNPPATAPGFDPFAPLRAKNNAPPPPPPPDTRGVGDALLEAARGADNFVRAYADDWSYGGLDSALGGNERQKTIQAKDELGAGGRLAAGGMATLTNPISAGIKTGSILKSGVVGAGQGMLDAYGHGGSLGDVAWGGLTGFGVGSGLHGLGLGAAEMARRAGPKIADTTVGKGITQLIDNIQAKAGIKTPGAVTAAADADQQAAFRNLDNFRFNANDALAGAQGVQSQLFGGTNPKWVESQASRTAGYLRRYAGDMQAAQTGGQTAGGNSLHSLIRDLNDVINKNAGSEDAVAAKQARDAVLQMSNRLTPVNGTQGGFNAALDVANNAHGTYKNAKLLEDMGLKLDQRGDMPGGEANTILDDKTRAGFYNPDQKAALSNIGATGSKSVGPIGGSPLVMPAVTGFGAAATGHGFGPLAAGAVAGGALDAARQLSTKAGARQAVADAYPAMTGNFMQNPEQQTLRAMKYIGLGSLGGDDSKPTPYQYGNNPWSGYINDMLPESWQR